MSTFFKHMLFSKMLLYKHHSVNMPMKQSSGQLGFDQAFSPWFISPDFDDFKAC